MQAAMEARVSLGSYGVADDEFLRDRRFMQRAPAPVRGAGWLMRRVTRMDEPPEDTRRYPTKISIVADLLWNLSYVVVGVTVLAVSGREHPAVPLRFWVCGYVLLSVVHFVCLVVEKRGELGLGSEDWSEPENETEAHEGAEDRRNVVQNVVVVNSFVSAIWWIAGLYWVVAGNAISDAPRLYWLCITFLVCDIFLIIVCFAATCLYFLSICCCFPCILAILPGSIGQDGATEDEINTLPKFKFCKIGDSEKVNGEVQESLGGLMTQSETDIPKKHVNSQENSECCICLEVYKIGEELRQLPCHHRFHCLCIDKWLRKKTTCPLCKFNILKPMYETGREEV